MPSKSPSAVALEVWLIRHGETEWSRDKRHTGRTDLPLTERGEADARALSEVLRALAFDLVLSSPRQRALRTATLAGFANPIVTDDLAEWDYGDYEGITRTAIHEQNPDWSIWTDGAPGGEAPGQVRDRVDRVIARCQATAGRCLLFAHGHVLRTLAACWLDQPVSLGEHLPLDTAKISVLGFDRGSPTLDRWNADR
jgi:broad specificity phosphatase PhoE